MEMGHSHKMEESRCGPLSVQRLKRPTTCNMFPITLCVCRTHCRQAAVRLRAADWSK
jgi:hypothetical protein